MPYEKIGKNEPVCIADEVPFEIPESWEWVRLGTVCEIARGGSPRPIKQFLTDSPSGINWIKISDSDKGGKYINATKEKIIPAGVAKSRYVHAGDFLLTNSMSFGRPYILNVDGCIHDGWLVLSDYQNAYDKDFLFYMLSSAFAYSQFCDIVSGAVVKNLNSDKVSSVLFPLPPITEQRRIVTKLDEVKQSITHYTKSEIALSNLTSSFPQKLKKSILQYAIQGKLVPQDPTDEPASALLERIRAEKEQLIKSGKIKRDKHESVIFRRDNSYYERVDGIERCIDDEIPFEIPDGWEWVRLKNIVNVVSARRVHQSDWKESGVPFYRAREIAKLADDGYVDNELFISENLYNEFSKSGAPQSGDLMVTAVGTLGKVYVVQQTDKFYYKDASVICFMNFGKLNPEYLKLIMMSPFMVSAIKDHSTGTTVGTITLVTANEYLVPVPPFLEQTRIVAHFQKLNHLINACNMY